MSPKRAKIQRLGQLIGPICRSLMAVPALGFALVFNSLNITLRAIGFCIGGIHATRFCSVVFCD